MIEKIEELLSQFSPQQIKRFCEEFSDRYRKRLTPFLEKREHRFAYLATRFPATCAAITRVLKEAASFHIETMLDLGAGPGTGYLAAQDVFPSLKRGILVETDPTFIEISQKLIPNSMTSIKHDLKKVGEFEACDLVLLSYSIGEIPESYWDSIFRSAWQSTKQILVVIEPGTPQGFSHIRRIRDLLISYGASIVAPCPHAQVCPMQEPDWCHFSTRLSRSSVHKMAKSGALGFEDEKFSYVICSKINRAHSFPRILRPPQKRPGHTIFSLCKVDGLKKEIITKKDKNLYKKSKKLDWGDTLS